MAKQSATLVIVFADISGSTELYERLGDGPARTLVAQCLQLMTKEIERQSGTVIKTIGDEIMCTFTKPDDAMEAAMAMQECVAEDLPGLNSDTPADMSIRVGMHFGPAILEGGDVFGDAVNVAARMAAEAKGGQIFMTEETVEGLTPLLRGDTRHLDRMPVKGRSEAVDVYEVVWQPNDVTRIAAGPVYHERKQMALRLRYHEQEIRVDQSTGTIVLGRGKRADVVVNDSMASREHARIECRRDKFVLTDLSTNGTYVLTTDGPAYLRREETTLSGTGKITFGRQIHEAEEFVTFDCES